MAKEERIPATAAIETLGRELGYSRPHVAAVLRRNQKRLRAIKHGRFWMIPLASIEMLRTLVQNESGPRYKKGERGPNVR